MTLNRAFNRVISIFISTSIALAFCLSTLDDQGDDDCQGHHGQTQGVNHQAFHGRLRRRLLVLVKEVRNPRRIKGPNGISWNELMQSIPKLSGPCLHTQPCHAWLKSIIMLPFRWWASWSPVMWTNYLHDCVCVSVMMMIMMISMSIYQRVQFEGE